VIAPIDFAHPHYREDNPYNEHYGEAIGRLTAAFRKDETDKAALLADARAMLQDYTFAGCREAFGLDSPFTLAKEMYCDVLACNAAVVARLLEQDGKADEAKAFLLDLYREGQNAGYTRDEQFFLNRLDSRTFMPMRRHIDAAYLEAIGFRHPDRVLLCVGDCQTIQIAEWLRGMLTLPGREFAAYQHSLGSLIDSPLGDLFRPDGYFFFVNAAANLGLYEHFADKREENLAEIRRMVAWLQEQAPAVCVFVTHVFFGVENAIRMNKVPRTVAEDAVGAYSDEVAALLAEAPNVKLVKFTDVCPLERGLDAFRDNPDRGVLLHFHFDIMHEVARRVAAALQPLERAPAG